MLRGRLYYDDNACEWYLEDEKRGTIHVTDLVQELASLEHKGVMTFSDKVDEGYVEIALGFKRVR